jgi:copper ion binding protein
MSQQPVVTTITVAGMSCAHCVKAVTEEVSKLDGVASVDIDLASGAVRVESDRPIDADALKEAVDEAGYEVVT